MMKTLSYAVLALAITNLTSVSYASTKTEIDQVFLLANNSLQNPPTRWRLVKHTFRLHIPRNSNALSQLFINTPSTVAVSNDIDVLDQNGQKLNINISVNGRKIIINFPQPVFSNTKLLIEFNKVKQPILGPASVYSFSAKLVGSSTEIPLGGARFPTF